ncbi:signal recognition particle-docking protein FtsY [Kushneria avicenniae]|uniref:Signal recognition particle receptor FtsY n=1 Tax=Kushneria avicenniae TaxID=402385 RepID=A0A1I1HV92_9GAMM|nr:signal recognition particle-docking protein FtsY [Kushneria avicenniae]SFC27482.1 signal recognition particle-docking protein FtsY [Kushneria avicenniae]
MFGFFKRKKQRRDQQDREEQQSEQQASQQTSDETDGAPEPPAEAREARDVPPAREPESPAGPVDETLPDTDTASPEVSEPALEEKLREDRDSEPVIEPELPVEPERVEPEPAVHPESIIAPDPEPVIDAEPEPVIDPEPVQGRPVDAPASPDETLSQEAPEPAPEAPPLQEAPTEKVPEVPPEETAPGVASEVTTPARNRGRDKPSRSRQDMTVEVGPETADEHSDTAGAKKGWFSRMRQGLGKTRSNLTDGLATLLLGHKEIDDDLLEELETQLLMADVGVAATSEIMENLEGQISRRELKNVDALYKSLQQELSRMLEPVAKPLRLPPKGEGPFVILMVGVNGVGKTTTIGKLTQRFQRQGRSVMLAAGDTFRAAAVEQLQVWGERNDVPVIAQHTGADSASVIYDAVSAAKARGIDVLIADTAGRLHNKNHLMDELSKVQRVMARLDAKAPHEVMLVLDAGTGQNAISQAETFNQAVPVTGITLTKLDGTAKGGIIFAIAKQLGTPIRYIGVGETLDDLRPFEAEDFVGALFDRDGG